MKQFFQSNGIRNRYRPVLVLSLLCVLISCQAANDSVETSTFTDTVVFPPRTKANLLKPEDIKSRINNRIKGIDKEDDLSKLDFSSLNGINRAIAIFKIYARTVREGNASPDKEVLKLTKTLQRKAVASQIKNFPRIRNAYYKIAKNQLWERDIDVTLGGTNNTTLKLSGGYFAANANIKGTQESLQEILKSLRFKQTQYRWYKGQDEYTYYKIESSKDAILLE